MFIFTFVGDLLERFAQSIKRFDLSEKRIRVAVSGGADSIALLELLRLSLDNTELRAIHINHAIREGASDEDALFVERFCSERGIPCEIRKVDVPSLLKDSKVGIEEIARDIRYRIFNEFVDEGEVVATAHTAGDVVETILFNLARGTGPAGLAGIPVLRDGVIRPLLDFWRAELEKWLMERGIEWREDESNLDLRFTRNRVRHMLVPQIRRVFGEGALENIRRTADIFTEEKKFLDLSARRLFDLALIAKFDGAFVFDSSFATESIWGFGEMIKFCLREIGVGQSDLNFEMVSRLFDFVRVSRRGGRAPIVSGVHIEADGELLIIFADYDRAIDLELELGKEVELPFGLGILLASFEGRGALVPYDAGKLNIRLPRAGDRIDREHKLKRYLARNRIPRFLRDIVPIVFSGEKPIFSPIAGTIPSEPGLYTLRIHCEGPIKRIFDWISSGKI